MGIQADLFVASQTDALRYEASQLGNRAEHVEAFHPAEFKGLTSLEFETLFALLTLEEWSVEKHMLDEVLEADEGETWLYRFPAEFVALLAALSPDDLKGAAGTWAESEELSMAGFQPEDTEEILRDLVRLAREAKAPDLELHLFGSL